jgi:hypothetical protein
MRWNTAGSYLGCEIAGLELRLPENWTTDSARWSKLSR